MSGAKIITEIGEVESGVNKNAKSKVSLLKIRWSKLMPELKSCGK